MAKADADFTTKPDLHALLAQIPFADSGEPADGLSVLPLSDSPDVPKAALRVLARLRREAEAEIERLITLIDMLDPDPDLEEDDPGDLSWPEDNRVTRGCLTNDDDEESGDREPSLGWTLGMDQSRRAFAAEVDDLELEHDGREPDVDDEYGGR